METLWLFVYITNAVLVFLIIPFTMFYYEVDQDKSDLFLSFCVFLPESLSFYKLMDWCMFLVFLGAQGRG